MPLPALEWIAEQRIREAIEQGKLENLPGAGRPLRIELDHHLPPELRMAYTILKSAGFLPPVLELRRTAERQLQALDEYILICARYAREYRERIAEIAREVNTARNRKPLFGGKSPDAQLHKLTQMVQAYDSFRDRARSEVLQRLRQANACVEELQHEWLRENRRRPFGYGVDLSLVPPSERSVLARFEQSVPPLETEYRQMLEDAPERR